jgi:hypothetical protein
LPGIEEEAPISSSPRHQAPGPPPSHLWSSRSFGKNWRFGFCFVQFQEYFLCNFSEIQKQQKTGNWHCGILLIG